MSWYFILAHVDMMKTYMVAVDVGSIVEHVIDAHMRGRMAILSLYDRRVFFLFYCAALLVIMIYDLISIYRILLLIRSV